MSEREIFTCGDYEYALLEDGTAEIIKYQGDAKELEIPEELGGQSVTSIRYDAFNGCTHLTAVVFPKSIAQLGNDAFLNCRSLTEIILPENVEEIGVCAFSGCSGLRRIVIPPSVRKIGNHAFFNCNQAEFEVSSESYAEAWLTEQRTKPEELILHTSYGDDSKYGFDLYMNDSSGISGFGRTVVDWHDENGELLPPEAGQQRCLKVDYPFYGFVGGSFRALYLAEPYDYRDLIEHDVCSYVEVVQMIECQLLEIRSISSYSAEIYVKVLSVRYMDDMLTLSPSESDSAWTAQDADPWMVEYWRGSIGRAWDDDGWTYETYDYDGSIGGFQYIYTDDNGIDHCLAEGYWDYPDGDRVIFQDKVLGRRTYRIASIRKALLEEVYSTASMNAGRFWYRPPCNGSSLKLLACYPDTPGFRMNREIFQRIIPEIDSYTFVAIWDNAFHSRTLREIVLPNLVAFIGANAFSGCPNLERVIIPDQCRVCTIRIAPNAFSGCSEKLTFSVPEKRRDIIARLRRLGFRVEARKEGQAIGTEPYPELFIDDENARFPRPKIELHPEPNYPEETFYETDVYREGWSKLEKPNRNREQRR